MKNQPLMKKQSFKSQLFWWTIAVIYAGIFLTILFLAYNGQLPAILTQNDKPAHVILYCLATYLGHRVCNRRRIKLMGCPLPLFPALFTCFTVTEELLQSLSPNRSLDAMDLVASVLGIFIGYKLAERRKQNT